jgi:HD superfamily phosphohydrolase
MHHPFLEIPELVNLESGRGLVRIPCEQDVPFTPRVRAIVDTPEFQRLAHISQLGLASRVYPGATHTRFEHALGVFHNAVRYLWQLGKDRRFGETVNVHTAEVLLAASLLHDLGHWPFCHPIEDMKLADLPPHEEFAAEFLSGDRELPAVLRQEWGVDPDEVLDALVARSDTKRMRLVRSILSGPIDIDKMDYLDRDSLHAGVPYGRNFDRHRLIQSLVVNADGDGLAISAKGRTAAELMVFARYVMFSEVYWHHAVRSATSMFARGFYELRDRFDPRSLFLLTEADTIAALRDAARGTSAQDLMDGIFGTKRSLFKRVAEFSLYQQPEVYRRLARRPFADLVACATRLADRLSSQLGEPIRPTDVLIDAPPPDREVEFDVEIYFAKEDVYRSLDAVSPVVETLARTQFDDYVKRVRIFANPRHAANIARLPKFLDAVSAAIADAKC